MVACSCFRLEDIGVDSCPSQSSFFCIYCSKNEEYCLDITVLSAFVTLVFLKETSICIRKWHIERNVEVEEVEIGEEIGVEIGVEIGEEIREAE